MSILYNVSMDHEAHMALVAAILGGALAERNGQLTALLQHNRGHSSIANSVEREIDALARAASAMTHPKTEER